MTDTKYAVVMKKEKINGELYILVPQKLIKGTLDTTNGIYFYKEDKETFYDFSESSSITNPQVEELVAYTISENYLLQKYPNVDIEEAKKEAEAIKSRAMLDIQREQDKAKEDIRLQIIEVSSLVASKFISENINQAEQNKLVDQVIADLGEVKWQN